MRAWESSDMQHFSPHIQQTSLFLALAQPLKINKIFMVGQRTPLLQVHDMHISIHELTFSIVPIHVLIRDLNQYQQETKHDKISK